ncbi:hypothetical protein N7462_001167 [Penicillium macrosclerotiorum]|uniref:uncharacterized protein n=1 Tax=Penicillium macrosclerotiorum TaxID=303699 RepID=UPI00254669CF|nr:uncharacterized protein N7462_001167 [Penicillium macrosclerotiorum]KAJ5691744.1 hypothetical protein N7462_001167 [Penicillium macrosclerotiorum]
MTIAIAGAGAVGKTILETFLEYPQYQSQIIILTRSPKSNSLLDKFKQLQVDYDDVSATAAQLEKHDVRTVICTIGLLSQEASRAQVNLIKSSDQSPTTRRFIPSEYSLPQGEEYLDLNYTVQFFLDAVQALEDSSLQYTRIFPGYFMDYWAMPKIRTHLEPLVYAVDIANGKALIPGDGNNIITMTYSYDMAKFVVRLLDVEEWPKCSYIGGDDITLGQLVRLGEEIRGIDFEIAYDDLNKTGDEKPPRTLGLIYDDETAEWIDGYTNKLLITGHFELPRDKRLNAIFPDIKPLSMRSLLTKAWKP